MFVDIAYVVVGLAMLAGGGEVLVRGSVDIARHFNVTPAVIGLTVVAAGTSMPELWVSVKANLGGSPDFAAGNVIGSNIFNIGLILGISSVIAVIPVGKKTLTREWPFLFVTSLLAAGFLMNDSVGRVEGLVLVVLLAGFLYMMVRLARRDAETEKVIDDWARASTSPISPRRAWTLVILGMMLLAVGAEAAVRGASGIARDLGASERVIGITILAMGTSLPELASSLVAAARGRTDIAVGNVIGSNLFNTLGIVGVTALIRPLVIVDEFEMDVVWMLMFTLLLAPVLFFGRRVSRADGVLLLGLFFVYLWTVLFG